MELKGARILLTGAAGGIGTELARALAAQGGRLILVGRRPAPLGALAETLGGSGAQAFAVSADITTSEGRGVVCRAVDRRWSGAVDVLVHNAGVMDFVSFEDMDPLSIHRTVATNVEAPLLLTRMLLPVMLAHGAGRIVTVGSMLGSIAMPYFSVYSATKFALRGFSEGLRRELAGRGVGVTYVGPRSVRTSLNSLAVHRMAAATGMNMDEPRWVASRIVQAIARDRDEVLMGFPESLFARLNALLPRLIDLGLRRQRPQMERFARNEA